MATKEELARQMAHTYQGGANDLGPFAELIKNMVIPAINERVTGISANALRLFGKGSAGTNAVASDYMNKIGQEVDSGTRNFAKNAALSLYGETPEIRRNAMMEGYGALPFGTESLSGPMGAFAGMIAYHGSPHKFDKFKLDKIGTGEGAQAYGPGLYFAENPKVAVDYQRSLSGPDWSKMADEEPISKDMQGLLQKAFKEIEWHTGKADIYDAATQVAESLSKTHPLYKEAQKILRYPPKFPGGNLYKVDISDDAVKNFLDWDKPLSQQPESVRKLVPELFEMQKKIAGGMKPGDAARSLGLNPAYGHMDQGSLIYEILQDKHGADKASMLLKKAGVPGIRYLDQGSREAGKGSSNFVVFDEDIVKVLERK